MTAKVVVIKPLYVFVINIVFYLLRVTPHNVILSVQISVLSRSSFDQKFLISSEDNNYYSCFCLLPYHMSSTRNVAKT